MPGADDVEFAGLSVDKLYKAAITGILQERGRETIRTGKLDGMISLKFVKEKTYTY